MNHLFHVLKASEGGRERGKERGRVGEREEGHQYIQVNYSADYFQQTGVCLGEQTRDSDKLRKTCSRASQSVP